MIISNLLSIMKSVLVAQESFTFHQARCSKSSVSQQLEANAGSMTQIDIHWIDDDCFE